MEKAFTPNIKSKPDNKISILGSKTIIRPKRKDIENDFQWRTDTELSDLDATVLSIYHTNNLKEYL